MKKLTSIFVLLIVVSFPVLKATSTNLINPLSADRAEKLLVRKWVSYFMPRKGQMSHNKKSHKQFLKDLLVKNQHYRNGEFWIKDKYVNYNTKIFCENKYGELLLSVGGLITGRKPTIRSAVNPTQYLINQFKEVWGGIYSYDKVVYQGSTINVNIYCKKHKHYFPQTPINHLAKHGCPDCGYIEIGNKCRKFHKDFLADLNLKCNAYKNGELHIIDKYKGDKIPIIFKYKYGLIKTTPNNLLSNINPSIQSAVDKNSYFANQAREVHGEKYDYKLFNYVDSNTKGDIYCKKHDYIFPQTPANHVNNKAGCPICGLNLIINFHKKSPQGWGWKPWKEKAEIAKKNDRFNSFKLYIIKCWNEHEEFFKIGRTFRTVEWRFRSKNLLPYNYKIIHIIESKTDAKKIWTLERDLKRFHKEYKHIPKKDFCGQHECFSKIII